MQNCRDPRLNQGQGVPNFPNANYAEVNRGTFDGVASSFDARTHHAHNGTPTIEPGPWPVPFDHSRGLVTLDYITSVDGPIEGQPYFDVMVTTRIVYTDKILSGLDYQFEHGGFSPGTPPVIQPLTPCRSIALCAAASQSAKRAGRRSRKGPCEHGVKPRSKCKVCSACPHGRRRHRCKECGGASICEHGRRRDQCKECGGSAFCEHGRQRYQCKECGGKGICEHNRQRSTCKECGGCPHGRQRSKCKECHAGKQ